MPEKTVYETLSALDVSDKHKKKGSNTYLPWAAAWDALMRTFPDADIGVVKTPEGCIYHTDGKTCWVETFVTIEGKTRNQILPIMNHSNKSIAFDTVESTQASNSIMRCIVKNLALFGLDLNLWYGEELSESAKVTRAKKKESEKRDEEALAAVHQAILDYCTSKKDTVPDTSIFWDVIVKYSDGKKNPKAIKSLDAANACFAELSALNT